MQTIVDDVFKELFVAVSKQSIDIRRRVISVPQLRASTEERIQSDATSCRAKAGPSRRCVYDQLNWLLRWHGRRLVETAAADRALSSRTAASSRTSAAQWRGHSPSAGHWWGHRAQSAVSLALSRLGIKNPDTDSDPYGDTRKTCLSGGIHCPVLLV